MRVGRRALGNNVLVGVAAAAFIAIFLECPTLPWIILGAALIGYLATQLGSTCSRARAGTARRARRPARPSRQVLLGEEPPAHAHREPRADLACSVDLACAVAGAGRGDHLVAGRWQRFIRSRVFFSKMAVVTFGGAYAVLAYVAQQAVESYRWLAPGEMLDGLGMAETTPGPLIMVLQFVGFMAAFRDPGTLSPLTAGVLGGLLATWVTFTPCFLWIFLGAPFVEKLRDNKALSGAMTAITAAVCGVILNLAVWFAVHTIFRQTVPVRTAGLAFDAPVVGSVDVWALVLAIAAAFAIFRFKVGMMTTLAGSCAAGIALHLAEVV